MLGIEVNACRPAHHLTLLHPDWDAGCKHCSFWADNFDCISIHLNHRDVTMVAVSRNGALWLPRAATRAIEDNTGCVAKMNMIARIRGTSAMAAA
jgi:uncharacterized protein DUF899